jgi:hypothetical protein
MAVANTPPYYDTAIIMTAQNFYTTGPRGKQSSPHPPPTPSSVSLKGPVKMENFQQRVKKNGPAVLIKSLFSKYNVSQIKSVF